MLIFKWRKFFVFLGDVGLFYLALTLALVARRFNYVSFGYLFDNFAVFSLFLPVWVAVFYSIGFYDIRRLNKLITLLNQAIVAFSANLVALTALFYLFSPQLGVTPKTNLFFALLFFHLLAAGWRGVWTKFFFARLLVQRVVFLGNNPLVEEMKRYLREQPHLGFAVLPPEALKTRYEQSRGYWRPRGRRKGGLDVKFDLLVLVRDAVDKNAALENIILAAAVMEEIPVVTHLDFYEDLYGKIPPEHAARLSWLLSNILHKNNGVYVQIKRALELIGALAGLIITLPFTALVYLALKLEGGAGVPVFYFQKRVGYLGRRFVLWKFRTMARGADKAGPFSGTLGHDARVTPLGTFLRKMRLDELPQLWNVVKGDMALVGPRPEWIREVSILEHTVPHYHLRHLVQPGITGWAQIHMPATASEQESFEKLHYDLYYVKNMSLALDIGILLRTFHRIFKKDVSFLADIPGKTENR